MSQPIRTFLDNYPADIDCAAPLGEGGFKWALPSASHTETQTLYCRLSNDALFFIQLAHANFGLGDNVQYTYRYYDRSANFHHFRSTNTSGQKVSSDRKSTNVSPMKITAANNTWTFEVTKPDKVTIAFTPECRSFKLGHGKTMFGSSNDPNYIGHEYMPRGKVSGTLVVNKKEYSLEGIGFLVHAMQRDRPHNMAIRWNFAVFHSERATLSLMEFQTPKTYGNKWVAQGALVLDGEVAATATAHQTVTSEAKDPDSNYSPPENVEYRWEGLMSANKKFEAVIKSPATLCGKIDMLEHLPWVLRKIIQSVVAKPFNYMYWDNVEAHIKILDAASGELVEEITQNGWMMHEVTFMN